MAPKKPAVKSTSPTRRKQSLSAGCPIACDKNRSIWEQNPSRSPWSTDGEGKKFVFVVGFSNRLNILSLWKTSQ